MVKLACMHVCVFVDTARALTGAITQESRVPLGSISAGPLLRHPY